MNPFKNYKKLYETEVKNRKLYEERYKEVIKENVELQKKTGIARLKKQLAETMDELFFIKKDRAIIFCQLEDTRNELKQLKAQLAYKKRRTRKVVRKDGEQR